MSSNPPILTDNRDEYSRTVLRANGDRLDICVVRHTGEFLVALVNDDNTPFEEIVLSAHERTVLLQHLNDPITQSLLGGNDEKEDASIQKGE